jgi:hypothetical protein
MVRPVLTALRSMLARAPGGLLLLLRFSLPRRGMTGLLRTCCRVWLLLGVRSHVCLLARRLLLLHVLAPGVVATAIAMVLLGSNVLGRKWSI